MHGLPISKISLITQTLVIRDLKELRGQVVLKELRAREVQ
jgi:hypothetical protein